MDENQTQAGRVRLNLQVDGDVPELLARLAKGRNRMGEYISHLVKAMADGQLNEEIDRLDLDGLRLMVQGLGGRVKALDGEMLNLRANVAALIAKNAKIG